MKSKLEVFMHVPNFVNMVETQHKTTPQTIRTNNGPEFSLSTFYNTKGIQKQMSCVKTPQQNRRVERKHQHILNI